MSDPDYRLVTDSDTASGVSIEELKVGMAVGQAIQFSEHVVQSYASLVADFAPVHSVVS